MLKAVFFCHPVLSFSSVLPAEPGLFTRLYLVSFQSAKNRVKHVGLFGEEGGSLTFSTTTQLLSLFNAVVERKGLMPSLRDYFGTN